QPPPEWPSQISYARGTVVPLNTPALNANARSTSYCLLFCTTLLSCTRRSGQSILLLAEASSDTVVSATGVKMAESATSPDAIANRSKTFFIANPPLLSTPGKIRHRIYEIEY